MINLLPPGLKDHYHYGRRNTVLRRWAAAMIAGLAGTCLVTFAGFYYMQSSIDDYNRRVTTAEQQLKADKIDETQKQAEEMTANLKLAVSVLSKEVQFSKLLKQIGAVTPPNTVLTDLSISEVVGAIELTAVSSDYTSATQMQVNLEDPANKIFSKADIININCDTGGNVPDPRYPCSIRLRALFADDNPFLYINQKADRP